MNFETDPAIDRHGNRIVQNERPGAVLRGLLDPKADNTLFRTELPQIIKQLLTAIADFERQLHYVNRIMLELHIPIGFYESAQLPCHEEERHIEVAINYDEASVRFEITLVPNSIETNSLRIVGGLKDDRSFTLDQAVALSVLDSKAVAAVLLHHLGACTVTITNR